MINRNKAIRSFIALAMCTSLINASTIQALEAENNEGIQVNILSFSNDLGGEENITNSGDSIISAAGSSDSSAVSTTGSAVSISKDISASLYYITVQKTENGIITLDESSADETTGYFKYIIKPNNGYEIKDVVVDGKSRGACTYYEFKNLTEAGHTISAVFKEIKHPTGYIPEFVQIPYVYKTNTNKYPLTFGIDQATASDSYYNTISKDYISSVKDQGQLDTCWTFSSLGTFESSLLKKNGYNDPNKYDFSENNMRYALSSDGGNALGFDRTNYGGGNFDMALAYLTRGKMNGAVNENDDLYPSYAVTTTSAAKVTRTVADISSKTVQNYYPTQVIRLGNLPSGADKEARKAQIKDLIMKYGSVTLSYDSESAYYNKAGDGTEAYYNPSEIAGSTNHAVSIVGWDDNYSIDHFKSGYQPVNKGAFLVKNSWGNTWGQNGYFYISYDDANAYTGINSFKEIKNRDFFNNVYEYDTFGRAYIAGYTGNHDVYYANVFNTKKQGIERLSAISTYCNYPDSYIRLYVSTDGGKTFSEQTAGTGYTYVASKGYKIDEAGYYTFMLDNLIQLNCSSFAVAIEVQQAGSDQLVPIEGDSYSLSSNAIVENGSYVGTSMNGLIADINSNSSISHNTCVKAFTENIVADKAALQNLYNANKDKTQGNYTAATWAVFTNTLLSAKTVLDKTDPAQTEVDAAYAALNSAISGLAQNPTVNKTELQNLYNIYKGYTQGNYTSTSWYAFLAALSNANAVLQNANAAQSEIDTANNNLQLAASGLTSKRSFGGGGGGGGGGGTSLAENLSDNPNDSDAAANSGTADTNLSNANKNISSEISTLIKGQIKSNGMLKTNNGNSIACTDITAANGNDFKVLTTSELSSNNKNNSDTISIKTDKNVQVYIYVEEINKYLPLASQKDGYSIKINVKSNETYVMTTGSLPAINAGWNKIDTSWYMVNADGSIKTGWLKDTDGSWYNLSDKGKMNIGWLKDTDGTWYNLSMSGRMNTGWLKDADGKWYFLKSSGAMALNEYVDGYYLGASGAWKN